MVAVFRVDFAVQFEASIAADEGFRPISQRNKSSEKARANFFIMNGDDGSLGGNDLYLSAYHGVSCRFAAVFW
jgi:hypothetical protein